MGCEERGHTAEHLDLSRRDPPAVAEIIHISEGVGYFPPVALELDRSGESAVGQRSSTSNAVVFLGSCCHVPEVVHCSGGIKVSFEHGITALMSVSLLEQSCSLGWRIESPGLRSADEDRTHHDLMLLCG